MITLRWGALPGSDVTDYKVYRSIIGFMAPVLTPGALNGLTLQLKMNGGPLQTITFNATDGTIETINQVLEGGRAFLSQQDATLFILRSDIRTAPGSVEIVGGTTISTLGLTPRLITEKSEDKLVTVIPAPPDPTTAVEYEDPDGVCQDWYAISTVCSGGSESPKTDYRQPVTYSGAICVLEGLVTDLQGRRIPDAEITATLVKYPVELTKSPQITLDPITVLSGPDGRFSLPLLQGALVELKIPSVGFSRNITVPNKPFEFVTNLMVDLDYRFPLEYR